MGNRYTIISLIMFLAVMTAQAQIKIGGSVYGGGNAGNVSGNTAVTVYAGDLNEVFGGARQADVGGHAFTHINGEEASDYILINRVYGGNDISGQIGTNETLAETNTVPTELTAAGTNGVDNTWNTFVRVSSSNTEEQTDQKGKVYLGQLFGGGNGAYDYTSEKLSDGETANPYKDLKKPELGKTYLEIVGGSMVYAFGGGNNATVTDKTVIYVNNTSPVVNSVIENDKDLLTDTRLAEMGFNPGYTYPTSAAFQIGSFFGGNNLEAMHIRPQWNLQKGKIRNLYSGGNRGAMTSPVGLLLEINPNPEGTDEEKKQLVIDNVYGGCRMADVHPLTDAGDDVAPEKIQLSDSEGYMFPSGLSARVLVRGGDINNVYGGNDITGHVYGGNAVGVYTSIRGDVYGGGNGAYPYTDNAALKDDPTYGDLYYEVPEGKTPVQALNDFRPNAEQVSLRLYGTEDKPTIIGGSVYVGGNCATLATTKSKPTVELKVGSYVYADNVFLGNNGEGMVQTHEKVDGDEEKFHDGVLRTYNSTSITSDGSKFNSMVLTDSTTFDKYMDGVVMELMPSVVFDSKANGDPDDYDEYTTYFGSFYCGGNIGSMKCPGKTTINFSHQIIIFNKLVGGSNNADVKPTDYFNAAYNGGLLGEPDTNGDKLELNLLGLKIQPKRWVNENNKSELLEWNTIKASTGDKDDPVTDGASEESPVNSTDDDKDRRLTGGNIYGGCYTSGHVNGNVIINLEETIFDRDVVFDVVDIDTGNGEPKLYDNDTYKITKRNSGVILDEQGMDVLGAALNVFGGGYGKDSEIWGSTTINLNKGYTFQIFGGSEQGVIGKPNDGEGEGYPFNGKTFKYNPKYSCTINVKGLYAGVYRGHSDDNVDMAEAEFIYGGGFFGPICGNTTINLGNGRVFNTFAGSCMADILGHTETYVGRDGFPYVRDYVYGGNDLGGRILGLGNFSDRVRTTENGGYDAIGKVSNTDMLNASAYVEYQQGRVEKIYGGCYGVYDYTDDHYGEYFYNTDGEGTDDENKGTARDGYFKPRLDNAFVNFRPTDNSSNIVNFVYGAGEGYSGEKEENKMQNRSYILVDIPQTMTSFERTEFFGAGERGGVGMAIDSAAVVANPYTASAVIDLARGKINAVYGGSYEEGVTRRTEVNVPAGSTIQLEKIFGGAYGTSNEHPCDVYEANVNWSSSDALVGNYRTGIYGGNNAFRRTLYSKVNINAPIWYDKTNDYYATVYGAGYGKDTWSQYTEVNLNNTAQVYEVYGGGQLGRVMSTKSVDAWKAEMAEQTEPVTIDLGLDGYTDTGLDNALAIAEYDGKKYNTNVLIQQGAWVSGYMYNGALSGAYAYGGGQGDADTPNTGDVHGTTFIGLFGGKVDKDIYAAGTAGSVNNKYKVLKDDFNNDFVASANAYIEGGTCRNVYGGGWKGSVGYHDGDIKASTATDVLGETHVVIGKKDGTSFTDGIPAIERNAYGGGEGGAVFGTTNITLNNGFVGYRYFDAEPTDTRNYLAVGDDYYQEKLDDETFNGDGTNRLYDSGCIFGGGYIDNSSVDKSHVFMYGGHVRNSLFGGGEIAAIGRGVIDASGENNSVRSLQGIYKAGQTNVTLYEGHVHRNVFGGGRGYNYLGEGGTLYSDGYVFGQTRVNIRGGEVGNAELGTNEERNDNGNVFGGGDIGYVYSAYEEDGKLHVGIKDGDRYDGEWEGYYYKYRVGDESNYGTYIPSSSIPVATDAGWIKEDGEYVLTEDSKVLVEPNARVTAAVTINGKSYAAGDYVPIDDLNRLGNKNDGTWSNLDQTGVTIHNAVFAGGNTSSGSSTVFANATTVFGNATASIHDVYKRDLITIGSHHVGGLYGDGNLTFVDGYRGLNITNYGTDYYSITDQIDKATYDALPQREKDYYELRYKCLQQCTDKEGKTYTVNSIISRDELVALFSGVLIPGTGTPMVENGVPNSTYWEENGVMSRYAGRPMNTVQRADFCGVWGSRMVMQGAQDRVPETVDYNNYTINRVREVSLNKKVSPNGTSEADDRHKLHGNYFGIYNVVNFLGALSSDFDFGDKDGGTPRTSDNTDTDTYGPDSEGQTFFDWKKNHINERKRNNGNSHNQVALASGVYLELTSEDGTGTGLYEKKWGYITGVIELDLINVQTGVGGGFVYAKNVHGKRTSTNKTHHTITELNSGAVSYKMFTYSTDDDKKDEWQTSGNFVHSTQTIIDDCYNVSAKYKGSEVPGGAVPAHYWYIKGSVYVYDQYISAYTGAPNAYSEQVEIPLTITAASHGTMKLLNVMPNKYAYYSFNDGTTKTPLAADGTLMIGEVEYALNTPISYWDWYLLTPSERDLFVEDTYYVKEDCKIGDKEYKAGTVLLKSEYDDIRGTGTTPPIVTQTKEVNDEEQEVEVVDFDFIFRSSNNLSHDNGYILTYKVNNPVVWDNWYTPITGSANDKVDTNASYSEGTYNNGPTYHLNGGTGMLLGQREYQKSDVISEDIYTTYQSAISAHEEAVPSGQASFEPAYIVTRQVTIPATATTEESRYYVGATVSATEAATTPFRGKVDYAYICTHTIQLSATEYIYMNTKMSEADKNAYLERFTDDSDPLYKEIQDNIVPAYYCTSDGLYGGNYYAPGNNYRGLEVWASMSADDRAHFDFNYDALDVLIDPTYSRNDNGSIRDGLAEGKKYQYDSADEDLAGANANKAHYSLQRPIDYTATYDGTDDLTLPEGSEGVKVIGSSTTTTTITNGDELDREEFEKIPNEKRHYAALVIKDQTTMYVVKKAFQVGNSPYAVGQTIDEDTYDSLGDKQGNVQKITFNEDDKNKTFYFCREDYTKDDGNDVSVGEIIDADTYGALVNLQSNFTIHGISPTEVSTLYVSRESDIYDLSKEKIITVIYQYDYEEADTQGNITPVSERHVVNIHIDFKSGIPFIEDIKKPQTILPGTKLGLREPVVTSGAYEVTGGGWELFETIGDAENHLNGIDYLPNIDQLYWYQNGYYLAYYAKTYLGKTYSNHEPISVANYHDLTKVMADTDNHYFVDNKNVKRDPKIYVTDGQNGAQQLKDLFDLSLLNSSSEDVDTDGKVITGDLAGHSLLDNQIKSCANLDIIMHTNVEVSGDTDWTPIADNEGECFEGNLHGDGYYISGLNNSLFNHLCGNVYNLGVMGSFTGAGIAESGIGYVENCWVSTSSTEAKTSKPVFGNPTGSGYQIVNCYYQEDDDATNKYTNHSDTYGIPARMPASAFYNGTVAYDLNGFYLYKRYNDAKNVSTGNQYTYYTVNAADGNLSEPTTGHYETGDEAYCSSTHDQSYVYGYVEDRYADGDFRYADGSIPETDDVRTYVDGMNTSHFYPIWPDDYIYFGQMLTYKWNEARPHEEVPSHIYKSSGRLVGNDQSNRVYRAPAYYQSKEMDVAHFNPAVNLVAYSKPQNQYDTNLTAAYPNMTAIDFAGHNDTDYKLGLNGKWFYQPLLDDDGLVSIANRDETPNLLVYAPSSEQNEKTYNVLTGYFTEPVYSEKYKGGDYRCVDISSTQAIYGHLVQSDLTATNDHQLVDKRDFNCPISYSFDSDHRMWYQRTPERYVSLKDGWETVSLPFTAELVTTQQKGEITHFYSGSRSVDENNTKTGHEYWLRVYKGKAQKEGTDDTYIAAFNYPDAAGDTKTVGNTFLWDYYYNKNARQDANTDIYQRYYETARDLKNYPLLANAVPYIIGFPGTTYYEFDLSGQWTPSNTALEAPARLDRQTITFASNPGITVQVSDDEGDGTTAEGYIFKKNYVSKPLTIGTTYVMSSNGSSFDKTTAATTTVPFRPYFEKAPASGSRQAASRILFDSDESSFAFGDEDPSKEEIGEGDLLFTVRKHEIAVTSSLRHAADVRIVNVSGITVANFTIQPGETIERYIPIAGVYVVRADGGRIQKKIALK